MTKTGTYSAAARRKRRAIAALTAVGIGVGGAGVVAAASAQAAPQDYPVYGYNVKGQGFTDTSGHKVTYGSWDEWVGSLRMPGDFGTGFCVDAGLDDPMHSDSYVDGGEITYKDSTTAMPADVKAQLAYVLYVASGYVKAADNGGSVKDANDYAAAAQDIIHAQTAPVPPMPLGDTVGVYSVGYDQAWYHEQMALKPATAHLPALIDSLWADAKNYAGPWTLNVTPAAANTGIGQDATFTVSVKSATNVGVPSITVPLTSSGLTGAPASVTTGADGTATFTAKLNSSVGSATASTTSPSATVEILNPTSAQNNFRSQRMALMDSTPLAINASANVNATAATIATSATDQSDGDKILAPQGGTIVDVVNYTGLTPGSTYTIKGELMDKATGLATGITGEATITPTTASGSASVNFVVPAGFAGTSLVAFETVYDISGEVVGQHTDITDTAQTVDVDGVKVSTVATDQADGDKVLAPSGGTIVDVVSYQGLKPGDTYTLKGELMDKATGISTGITAESTFVPTSANGSTELAFTVPAGFAGESLVAFEKIYNANGELIGQHSDITDVAQTVDVDDVKVATVATDLSDGDKYLAPEGGTIVDVVNFEGLVPGQSYTIKGELMDKATGGSTGIVGETTFTATTSNGSATVNFTVPAGHQGKSLVAFEKLLDATGHMVGVHADINSAEQTVSVDVPGVALASTGSGNVVGVLIIGGALLLCGAGLVLARRAKA